MTRMIEQIPATQKPVRLFSAAGVTWATALGSLAAGGVVLALNYRRLGQKKYAWASLLLGLLAAMGMIAVATMLPDWAWRGSLIGQLFGVYALTRSLQGAAYDRHMGSGGAKSSNWVAAGIGVVGLVVFAAGYIVFLFSNGLDLQAAMDMRNSVDLGNGQEVYYARGATRDTAQALGDALKKIGFLTDQPATMMVTGQGKDVEVSLIVKDGAWDDEKVVGALRDMMDEIAASVGGKPFTLRLLDDKMKEHKKVKVE